MHALVAERTAVIIWHGNNAVSEIEHDIVDNALWPRKYLDAGQTGPKSKKNAGACNA